MKSIKKECYKLFQVIVVERDQVCQRPGCNQPATAGHHVFGRANMGTAFLADSGIGICAADHDGWARLRPAEVRDVLKKKVGKERYEVLLRLKNETCRWRDHDFMDAAVRLGVELIELRERRKKEHENG